MSEDKMRDIWAAADSAIETAYPNIYNLNKGMWGHQQIPNHGILRGAIAKAIVDERDACAAIKDAEIAQLRLDLKRQMEHNNFDATRLQRLATFCGVSCPESQEELLQVAGVVIGSCLRVLESNAKEIKTEIASRDLVIKELREALNNLRLFTLEVDSLKLLSDLATEALANSEHNNPRALEKKLLEARIDALTTSITSDFSQSLEFLTKERNKLRVKLAELNKE